MTTWKSFTRALVIVVLLATVLLPACSSGGDGVLRGDMGRVRVVLSSEPLVTTQAITQSTTETDHAPLIEEARVTFSSVLARNLDGELVGLEMDLPATVDLISLVNGREFTLPVGLLPPATYDQMVVVMTKVELTLRDGTRIELTPPGGGWTAIVRVDPFTVVEGEMTTVHLRFRAGMFRWLGDRFEFHPEFERDDAGSLIDGG